MKNMFKFVHRMMKGMSPSHEKMEKNTVRPQASSEYLVYGPRLARAIRRQNKKV